MLYCPINSVGNPKAEGPLYLIINKKNIGDLKAENVYISTSGRETP